MQTPSDDVIAPVEETGDSMTDANRTTLIAHIDDILPQTQCQQCGYEGCQPYAVAIAQGQAKINQCPPGGDAGIQALADLLNTPYLPLNTAHGITKPKAVAIIDEQHCIGCTLCIKACPVDAIMGASKHMHTVISAECTGCELCLAPCPVDCIVMLPIAHQPDDALTASQNAKGAAALARKRHQNRLMRLEREKHARMRTSGKGNPKLPAVQPSTAALTQTSLNTDAIKRAALAAAMARVKAQKTSTATSSPKQDT